MIKLKIAGSNTPVWINASHVLTIVEGREGFGGSSIEMVIGVIHVVEKCEDVVAACRIKRR